MSRFVVLASASALICVTAFGFFGQPKDTPKAATKKIDETQAMVTATTAFLNSLNADQRQKVQFPFTPQKTATAAKFARTGTPGGPGRGAPMQGPGTRPGTPGQQNGRHPGDGQGRRRGPGGPGMGPGGGFIGEQYGQAVWSNFPVSDVPRPGLRLGSLSAAQRDAAMNLLQVALSANGYQKVLEIMGSDQALSETGTPYCSGTACYTIGIFGKPSSTKPWMLEFGGHHLGLNLTMA